MLANIFRLLVIIYQSQIVGVISQMMYVNGDGTDRVIALYTTRPYLTKYHFIVGIVDGEYL